jgi:transcriptional regulator with XRE-family HTH domain
MTRQTQQVPVTGAEHPLRRARLRRGLTQVELAGLAGLASSYISMIERGQRTLLRRDHVNALAAALKVPPAEIAPGMIAGSDELAPAPAAACAFPTAGDDLTMAWHRDLAGRFLGHVISGDICAAGAWLRRVARDLDVSAWLLLDQLTTAQHAVPGLSVRPSGGNRARVISADSTGRGRSG